MRSREVSQLRKFCRWRLTRRRYRKSLKKRRIEIFWSNFKRQRRLWIGSSNMWLCCLVKVWGLIWQRYRTLSLLERIGLNSCYHKFMCWVAGHSNPSWETEVLKNNPSGWAFHPFLWTSTSSSQSFLLRTMSENRSWTTLLRHWSAASSLLGSSLRESTRLQSACNNKSCVTVAIFKLSSLKTDQNPSSQSLQATKT